MFFLKAVAAAATVRPDALDRRVLLKVEENSLAVGGVFEWETDLTRDKMQVAESEPGMVTGWKISIYRKEKVTI